MRKVLLFIFLLSVLLTQSVAAQTRTVTGQVTSVEDNSPLPGVNVVLKGSSSGTVTDAEGRFSIAAAMGNTIVFSYIGFTPEEVVVSESSTINVTLAPDVQTLNEVVVTSFGVTREKRALGYTVQEIKGSQLTETNQPNALNALRGRLAGVNVTSSGGAPGAGTNILIRGITSLNPNANNQPLFVVDGIPISNNTNTFGRDVALNTGGDNFQTANRAADINPDDIASISVLKGPAASALYGLRAANGAVIITTKSGQAGKARLDFRSTYSFDDVAKTPPMQTAFGNGEGGRYYFPNAQGVNQPDLNTYGPPVREGVPVYNVWDELFRTGHQFQNALTYSGGNEKATFFTSISSLNQTGVLPNSKYNRITTKLAGTLKATDQLSINGSASYIKSGGTNPGGGVANGSIFYAMRHTNTVDMGNYLNPDGTQQVYNANLDNPLYFAQNSYLSDDVNRFIGYIGADYTPTKWLTVNYKLGLDQYSDFRERVSVPGLIIARLGTVSEQRIGYRELNSNFLVTGQKSFGEDFNASLLLGNQFTHIRTSELTATGTEYIVNGFNSINNQATYTTRNFPTERTLIGFFADAKLDWRRTVYLNLTGRNDISSTLPVANRSFFYPSVSLSYIFTETLGLASNPIFNYGKVRASYAEVGKDASPYQTGVYFETYRAFGRVGGARRSTTFGSETLRPERTRGLEFGLELQFLRNRVGIDAAYAIQNSVDQIVPVPVSYASGYDVYVTNAGEIQNKSLELLLNAKVLQKGSFSWDASVNWSQLRGRVLSMPPGVNEIVFNPETPWVKQIIRAGGRPGDWYGWQYARVDDPNSEYYGQLIILPDGYPDVNANTYRRRPLSESDRIGNAFPDWTGGINNSLSWKGINLSFLFSFRKGGEVFDIARWQRYQTGTGAETDMRYKEVIFKGVRNVGTLDNPEYVPNDIPVELGATEFYRNAFRYRLASENNGFQDASWIRLQNVTLGYNLPKGLVGRTPFQNIGLSVSANNLWVTTPFVGFDPEASTYGSGSNAYGYVGTNVPTTRSIYFGLNVSL